MKRLGFSSGLLLLALFCLGLFLWQVITAFKPTAELTTLPPLWPSRLTLDHFAAIFAGHPFARIITNSLLVASASTALSLTVGSLAAFALAKLPVKRKGLILGLVLCGSMFPPIATVSPLYILIRTLGLRDTLLALILTYTSFTLPLTIWVLTHFFRSIPRELYAAARVDGCTPFQSFRLVMLPLAVPGLVATAILVFIYSWNEFLFALTFTATATSRTIPVGIALFPGLHEVPWGEIAAASVVVTLPLLGLVFFFQRRIIEGLTTGAVKG